MTRSLAIVELVVLRSFCRVCRIAVLIGGSILTIDEDTIWWSHAVHIVRIIWVFAVYERPVSRV